MIQKLSKSVLATLQSEDESVFYYDPSKISPPSELLARCHNVLVSDPQDKFGVRGVDIKRWCLANLKSFVWYNITDVSDVSYTADEIHSFWIADERDVTLFHLRWPT